MLRPSIVAAELVDGQATLSTILYRDPLQEVDGMPLLIARAGVILPMVESETETTTFRPGDQLLVLQRSGRLFARSLDLGQVTRSRRRKLERDLRADDRRGRDRVASGFARGGVARADGSRRDRARDARSRGGGAALLQCESCSGASASSAGCAHPWRSPSRRSRSGSSFWS